MSLEDWVQNGWLKRHETSRQEVTRLLVAVGRDLDDAGQDISAGSRFTIAYTAALRLCALVLYASGYRASRDQKHYRSIMALPMALGSHAEELARFLDRCRVKRHDLTYEASGAVSSAEARELAEAVVELREDVETWLREKHSELVPLDSPPTDEDVDDDQH